MVLSHEVITAEGRLLKPESQRASARLISEYHEKISNSSNSVHHVSEQEAQFEGTDPNHSPGVGHAFTQEINN